jgi:hypothetical protein
VFLLLQKVMGPFWCKTDGRLGPHVSILVQSIYLHDQLFLFSAAVRPKIEQRARASVIDGCRCGRVYAAVMKKNIALGSYIIM